jgi:2-haloacid dehalogenase
MIPKLLAFDMNGTLLDTGALNTHFQQAFGSPIVRREWFMEMIQLAMTSAITGYFEEFSLLGKAALRVVADRHSVQLSQAQEETILKKVRSLPPFPDVMHALGRLRDASVRMIVLTNSALSSAESSLSEAGVRGYFENVIWVESARVYKPAEKVYAMAAAQCGVTVSEMMMVAAHAWDTTGAIRAGCRAAFVGRPGEVLPVTAPGPELVVRDFGQLADRLLSATEKKAS